MMLLLANVLVLLMVQFFPKSGVKLLGTELTFLSWADFTSDDTLQVKSIQDILPAYHLADALSDTSVLVANQDSVGGAGQDVAIALSKAGHSAFRAFFERIAAALSQEQLWRVLHYGDSQIEGDRITAVIRERLQALYGGAGAGMVPIDEPTHSRLSVVLENSDNWERMQLFGPPHRKLDNGGYGYLGYSHMVQDSLVDTLLAEAKVTAKSNFFKRIAQGRCIRLLYDAQGQVEVTLNEKAYTLDSSALPVMQSWRFGNPQSKAAFTFQALDSFTVYAYGLDAISGVAVDNIPIRGSSGLDFTRINREHYKAQLDSLHVGLIIYQFGVNVVPHIVDDYGFYKRRVSRQLKRLQSLNPGVPILVIGTSDMSRKEGSNYVSYPNIEQVRNAQREAALETGCGFWDLYEVMGGQNAMPAWVFADPPLAQKDFIHLNPRGANIIGQKLFDALMALKTSLETTENQHATK